MTAPVPTSPDPADLWDYLVGKGLSQADATRHVMRMLQNQPAEVRRQYLKDVDPGALASFGLGAADMMSFGLGDQAARALWGQEATDTQQSAEAIHPTAHFVGEAAGLAIPFLGEAGLAKAGVRVAPTALGAAVRGIESRMGRAAAKTILNAATGAGYAGAQAAGHTEGGLAPRLQAAGRAAPYGAAAGAILPLGVAGLKATVGPTVNRFMDAVAGQGPAKAAGLLAPEVAPAVTHYVGNAVDDIAQAQADYAAKRISKADYETAMEVAGQAMRGHPGLLAPDPLEPPAYVRNNAPLPEPRPSRMAKGQPGAALPPAWQNTTPQAGGVGGHSYSGTYPVPDVPPTVVNAAPAAAAIRKLPYAQLTEALRAPETPKVLKDLILAEIQRRGITGPGLFAPR